MRAPLAALVVGLLWTSAALGQAIDPDKAQAWLEKTFGIKTLKVVEATPDDLVTLRSIEPRGPSDFHVIVHLENFRPPDPLTPPSSDEEFYINCPSRRFHVERIESFSEHGARGAQSSSYGPTVWGLAIPNSPEERIVAGVCGPPPPAPAPGEQALAEPQPIASSPPLVQGRPSESVPPASPAAKPASKAGPVHVQLFAGDKAAAEQFVRDLAGRRLPIIATVPKPKIVQGASGGHAVYRVQVSGFASAAEAARFCAAARSAKQDCFVPPDQPP